MAPGAWWRWMCPSSFRMRSWSSLSWFMLTCYSSSLSFSLGAIKSWPGPAPAPLQLLVLRQHAGRLLLSLHPSTVQRSPAAADTRADPHTIILREYLCMVASISLFHFSSWWLMLSTCCVFISRTRVGCTKNNLANSAAIKSHVSPVSRRL